MVFRKLFKIIYFIWLNKFVDVVVFKKGEMYFDKYEEVSFKNGNIEEWDFILMIMVFFFLIRCKLEVCKRFGYVIVLWELKKCCNMLLGYFFLELMFDEDFNYFWFLLLRNFIVFGVDLDDIV